MKPLELLEQAVTADGTAVKLMRRDEEYIIFADGKILMSSRMHGSEESLAALACRNAATLAQPSLLIGGLGMGFTLRAALDCLPPAASLVVVELLPAVLEWNRGILAPLAGHPLADVRVVAKVGDVANTLRSSTRHFDAVILDVDNGPSALTLSGNAELYGERGISAIRAALKEDGVLAVWSAREDEKFEQRLRRGGFVVEVQRVRGRVKNRGPRHVIFLGRKPSAGSRRRPIDT